MEFRTTVRTANPGWQMRHDGHVMLLGSCFSDNIGHRMRHAMIDATVNPFGAIYNPLSIASALHRLIDGEPVAGIDLFEQGGVWNSYDFHSRHSLATKEGSLERMNAIIADAHEHLRRCDTLIITLGTAVVYRLKATGKVVANCHKVPQHEFTRRLASIKEIEQALLPVMARLQEFNRELRVIFTVSPIRHVADGLALNSLSKATLRVAVDNVLHATKIRCDYFPAYEIVMDDLRDYRFYNADMIHPTEVAVDYLWQTFQATYFDDRSCQAIARCERVDKRLQHRPMNNNRAVVERFNTDTRAVLQNLANEYPYITRLPHVAQALEQQ